MSRVHRRGVVAGAGRAGGKTYAEFVAHITVLATSGTVSWSGQVSSSSTSSVVMTTCATATGTMTGGPWGDWFRRGSSVTCRVVQHCLPSEAEFNAQVASGLAVLLRISGDQTASDGFLSINRNGYTSVANAATTQGKIVTELIYWDGTRAQLMRPISASGPIPYDW